MSPSLLIRAISGINCTIFCFASNSNFVNGEKEKVERNIDKGFPGGAVVTNLPANARDTGSSPGLGRSHMPQSN